MSYQVRHCGTFEDQRWACIDCRQVSTPPSLADVLDDAGGHVRDTGHSVMVIQGTITTITGEPTREETPDDNG